MEVSNPSSTKDTINLPKTAVHTKSLGLNGYLPLFLKVLAGQILAWLGILTGFEAVIIQNSFGLKTPMLLMSTYYAFLFILSYASFRELQRPRFSFILIAVLDSQANFLTIYALSLVSFTFPFIINVLSVFWTVVFSCLVLKSKRYCSYHYLAISVCFAGIFLTLCGSNFHQDLYKNLKGISCCLISSALYAISAVLQEKTFVKDSIVYAYYPWLGLTGAFVMFTEGAFLGEFNALSHVQPSSSLAFTVLSFSATLIVMCLLATLYIKRCSAVMFNVSLVTQVFWSYFIDLFIFQTQKDFNLLYFLGFGLIMYGITSFYQYPIATASCNSLESLEEPFLNANTQACNMTMEKEQSAYFSSPSNFERKLLITHCNESLSSISSFEL